MTRKGDHPGRPGTPGHKVSEETRRKISEAMKAKWADPEYAEWHRARLAGNFPHIREDPEVCSNRLKRQWADPEWRAKMTNAQSAGAKRRWADPEKRSALLRAQGRPESPDNNK